MRRNANPLGREVGGCSYASTCAREDRHDASRALAPYTSLPPYPVGSTPTTAPAANGHGVGYTLEQGLAEHLAEPGMSDAELAAVVADALEQHATRPNPTTCRCLPAGTVLDESRCWRCGREVTRR